MSVRPLVVVCCCCLLLLSVVVVVVVVVVVDKMNNLYINRTHIDSSIFKY